MHSIPADPRIQEVSLAHCAVKSFDDPPTVTALARFRVERRMQPGLLLKLDPERVVGVENWNAAKSWGGPSARTWDGCFCSLRLGHPTWRK